MSTHTGIKRRRTGVVVAVLTAAMLAIGALPAHAAAPPRVDVRIEGASRTIFTGPVAVGTSVMVDTVGGSHTFTGKAIQTVGYAAKAGRFTYALKWFATGGFIDAIDGEASVPTTPYPGWNYRINGVSPLLGAGDVTVSAGDRVLWYFGTWDASPTAAYVRTGPVAAGDSVTVTALQLNPLGQASPLPGATVHFGSQVATSDASGHVTVTASQVGLMGVRVEKAGYVRSAWQQVRVGYPSTIGPLAAGRPAVPARSVILSGRLMSRGVGLANRKVQIQRRYPASARWVTVRLTKTAGSGRFRSIVLPNRAAFYRAFWPGDATHLAATSAERRIARR